MGRTRFLSLRAAELLVVAVAGGALALGGAAALGKLGDHKTINEVRAPASSTVAASQHVSPTGASQALTPEQIYQHDGPGVVQITATTVSQAPPDLFNFAPSGPQTSESLGSGFVIDRTGHIVTNYHVIEGAQKVQVSFSAQDQLPATVVGKDPTTDIAVLKVDTHARALNPLPLGDSDAVTVGDAVYAIGNPFGLARTLTSGLISAVGRQIFSPNGLPVERAIQTDAAINHGNSGGPLIDSMGRVIGVTSQIQTGSDNADSGNVGIGFAIPINTVRDVASQIISSGTAKHAYLGLNAVTITKQVAQLFNLPVQKGLLVQRVDKGTPAFKAGIKPGGTSVVVNGESYRIGGDIITKLNGKPIGDYQQLFYAILAKKPGDKVTLEVWHKRDKRSVTITLGART